MIHFIVAFSHMIEWNLPYNLQIAEHQKQKTQKLLPLGFFE